MVAPLTLDEIKRLSVDDRIHLMEIIWDTLAENNEAFPLTEEQMRELDRRLENYRNNPQNVIEWDEVKRRLKEIA